MRSVGVLTTCPFRGSEFYLSYWKGIKIKVNLNSGDIWRLNNTEGYAIIGFSDYGILAVIQFLVRPEPPNHLLLGRLVRCMWIDCHFPDPVPCGAPCLGYF